MDNYNRDGRNSIPEAYSPLSAWAYFWYRILFAIPIVGFVFLIAFSCGGTRNVNLRSYARSYWCTLIIAAFIAGIVLAILLGFGVNIGSSVY